MIVETLSSAEWEKFFPYLQAFGSKVALHADGDSAGARVLNFYIIWIPKLELQELWSQKFLEVIHIMQTIIPGVLDTVWPQEHL